MPRPEPNTIQLTIDGREVTAPEGMMLVDAAKRGDVEIPFFCYEPKLGQPVGACRMCLVEIEGIPKLQTSCSTPVKDGMVVHTQTDRVRHAQHAVVEFLLVNHPLDCPVCDKGGECPLQDITFGWGLGRSRFIEPKRHFEKPLSLSPLVAIDRERCILCYRCVRFSQEISEDYQLIFAERGADTFVATYDGHPYVAPFSGNIVDLCPVGALTSQPYRFRARPWDIEGSAGICTLCPSQCNVEFTVRDERVLRVVPRHHPDVDDGWLCDKGRFAYQAIHADERITRPLVRDGGELREVSWDRALEVAAGLQRHRGHVGALIGGKATNEEGFLLQRLTREALQSPNIDCRTGAPLGREVATALARPKLQPAFADLEFAHAVLVLGCEPLDDAPIFDLRIRKGVRRNGVKLAVATPRPSALDPNAQLVMRYAPGDEESFVDELAGQLAGDSQSELARFLREAGDQIVIVWGERLPAAAAERLLEIADVLGLADHDGAGLIELPVGSNGRGLREAGGLPDSLPGYAEAPQAGRGAAAIAGAAAGGALSALYLFETDPVRDLPNRASWEQAMHHVGLVVAHASVLTDGLREHASVVFPAESHAEKEGTVVHPDGRLQRLRAAIGHPGEVRPGWWVLTELSKRVGLDTGVLTSGMAFRQLVEAVPFYAGLTLDELGGRGVRWPQRPQADSLGERPAGPPPPPSPVPPEAEAADAGAFADEPTIGEPAQSTVPVPVPIPRDDAPEISAPAAGGGTQDAGDVRDARGGPLRLGTYRPFWAAPEVEISPALHFTVAHQQLELLPGGRRAAGHRGRRHSRGEPERHTATGQSRGQKRGAPGHRVPGRGHRRRLRQRADGGRDRGRQAVITYADQFFFEPWWIQIVKALVIFGLVLAVFPVLTVYERKLMGRLQSRFGPNRVGPFGLLQPMAEIVKFATKEPFRPQTSVGVIYRLAPMISLMTAIAVLAIIPFGNVQHIGGQRVGLYGIDVSIGPLYVFAFAGISFYGVMLGGWASGSKYAFLGAMRTAAQLISYEVSQGLSLVGAVITAGTLSLTGIVHGQHGLWYIVPQAVGFIIFFTASLAEINRPPFDLVEADTELVGGFNTEYGGTHFAAYLFAEYMNMIVVSAIATTVFLGGWLIPGNPHVPGWIDPFIVFAKMMIFITLFIWIRFTVPRLRYDQLMSFGWKVLLPLATLNVLVTAIIVGT